MLTNILTHTHTQIFYYFLVSKHYGALPEKGCVCLWSLESPFWKLAHQIYPPIELTGIGEIGFTNDNNTNRNDSVCYCTTNMQSIIIEAHLETDSHQTEKVVVFLINSFLYVSV